MFDFFKRANKSEAAGRGVMSVRAFAAAEVTRTLAPWKFDGGFSNAEVAAGLSVIRSRSRDMAKTPSIISAG